MRFCFNGTSRITIRLIDEHCVVHFLMVFRVQKIIKLTKLYRTKFKRHQLKQNTLNGGKSINLCDIN